MSNHEKAMLTYEALKKRKAAKAKAKDLIIREVHSRCFNHCLKLHNQHARHSGKGARNTKSLCC